MRKLLFLIIFASCSLLAISQTENAYSGGRAAGMGNAGITLQDTWAIFNNPAAMSGMKTANAGVFYENRFLLKETGFGSMAFTSPLMGGNFGVGITHFGYSLFQENKISLGFSQQLFKSFAMGVTVNYFSMRQSSYYGNLNALSFDVGLLSRPNDKFTIGAHIFNPLNLTYFEDSDLRMPVAMKLGFSYLFSKKLLVAVESGKAINGYVPIFKTGIEYLINEQFAMRTGISVAPVEYSFGFGYNSDHIAFDLAYSYHEVLGSTPKISLNYAF